MLHNHSASHLKRLRDSLAGPGVDAHAVAGVVRTMIDSELTSEPRVKEAADAKAAEDKRLKEEADAKAAEDNRLTATPEQQWDGMPAQPVPEWWKQGPRVEPNPNQHQEHLDGTQTP